jgi:hypothetical protein
MREVYGETIAIGRGISRNGELTREIAYPNLRKNEKEVSPGHREGWPGKVGFAGRGGPRWP